MTEVNGTPVLPPTTITHIAGVPMAVKARWFRQRCAWCDALLVDVDHPPSPLVDASGTPFRPQFAPPGTLLRDHGDRHEVIHGATDLPDDFCGAAATYAPPPDGSLCGAAMLLRDDRWGGFVITCDRPPHADPNHESGMGATEPNTGRYRWTGEYVEGLMTDGPTS